MTIINHDLHMHTYLSACCRDKVHHVPAAILAIAQEMEIATLGFADHLWVNDAIPPSTWYAPQNGGQITRLRDDLSAVSTSVRVLVGCEADMIAPGHIGMTRAFAATLDYVLLSCSHFHMHDFVEQPSTDAPRDIATHLLRFFTAGVASGLATIIAHPFLPFGYLERFDEIVAAISDDEFLEAFTLAASHGVGLEITTKFIPKSPQEFTIATPLRMLRLARRAGCRFTFGTDAHHAPTQRRLPELDVFVQTLALTADDLHPLVRG